MDLDSKKSEARKRVGIKLEFSYWLLTIAFTLFTFIIAVNPNLVKVNNYLALQLTISIPLYFSSIFARAKISTSSNQLIVWERFGFITFTLAYGLMINVVGILLAGLVSINMGLCFWAVNVFSVLLYSFLEIYGGEASFTSRFPKDLLFIGIIILLGILPVLGLY